MEEEASLRDKGFIGEEEASLYDKSGGAIPQDLSRVGIIYSPSLMEGIWDGRS